MKQKLNCILLIDDDKLTNFVHKIVVDGTCCPEHVIRKESAKSGLEYILDSSTSRGTIPFPDLILLDLKMPDIDGWGFLESLEELKNQLPSEPVILILSECVDNDAVLKASNFQNLAGIYNKPLSDEVYQSITDKYFPTAK